MKRWDIVIGLVILLVVGAFIFFSRKAQKQDGLQIITPTPQTLAIQDKIEENFKIQIPEDVDKAELTDVTGGSSSGIVTRKFENSIFTMAILADLPEAGAGSLYQGWLARGQEGDGNFSLINLGNLTLVKGGYMLNFRSSNDYTDHKNVVVTIESVNDTKAEKHILAGSFK